MGIMGSIEGGEDILNDGCDGHSPTQMRLRANEDLSVTDILMCRPRQIGLGHLVEIVTSLQHCEAKVIEVEERLQVVERVSAAQRRCIGIWQSHAVSLRQGEQHFGLERALQMHVQLSLRQRGDECGNFGHGLALSLDRPLCTRLSLGQTEQGLLLRPTVDKSSRQRLGKTNRDWSSRYSAAAGTSWSVHKWHGLDENVFSIRFFPATVGLKQQEVFMENRRSTRLVCWICAVVALATTPSFAQ